MSVPRWELGTNDFFMGERIEHLTEASGWFVRAGGTEYRVVMWAHIMGQLAGLGRVVGLVDDNGQLRPADKLMNAEGYFRSPADVSAGPHET